MIGSASKTNTNTNTNMNTNTNRNTNTNTAFRMLWVAVVSLSLSLPLSLPSASASASASSEAANNNCERLPATLAFAQDEAPRDLSSVLPVVVEKINRVLNGVVDVEVEWTGAELHGRVGEHLIETRVTRLTGSSHQPGADVRKDEFGRDVTSRCFHVPLKITDTDECSLPKQHPMRHNCHSSSVCVNTDGSYECECPRDDGNGDNDNDNDNNSSRNPWELSFSSAAKTSCPSSPSTEPCCPASAHSAEGKRCRQRFRCPVDPCIAGNGNGNGNGNADKKTHDCASSATCVRAESPNTKYRANNNSNQESSSSLSSSSSSSSSFTQLYTCQCPEGLMGNGRTCRPGIDDPPKPMLMFDGVTPTALTVKNNYYCGCTKPKIDACSGFPPCQGKHEICTATDNGNEPTCTCRPGYVHHETYGCVDVNPPTLKLRNDRRGDQTLRLKQGDEYREHMVDIVDDNAEDYLRSLKISYSRPLPPGCLTEVGEFHVNYTVAMPWANPPYVRIQRTVVIEDIDECKISANAKALKKFQSACPQLIPRCDYEAGAECRNTIGSYSCRCPPRTSGDGFLKSADFDFDFDPNGTGFPAPSSFEGGTSCVDTSKPVLTVQGPNPKLFRVAKCGGLSGVTSPYSGRGNGENEDDKEQLVANQQQLYGADIGEMIRTTAGAELCATHENPRVKPSDCISAIDHTYKDGKDFDLDLSNRVVVGDPVQKSRLRWVVPYDVEDDAGNQATTVYRDVVVEEVGLYGLEKRIREEVAQEERRKTKRAIDNAIRNERTKWESEKRAAAAAASNNGNNNNGNNNRFLGTCPACPACVCSDTDAVNGATCSAYCTDLSETCRQLGNDNFVYKLLLVLEDIVPVQLLPMIVVSFLVVGVLYVLQWAWTLVFHPKAYTNYDYGTYNSINDEMVLATATAPPEQTRRHEIPAHTRGAVIGGGANASNTLASSSTPARPPPPPPTASLSLANYSNNNTQNGTFFSPGSQMGSPRTPGFDPNAGTPGRSGAAHTSRDAYEGVSGGYRSPPLIVPSKNGDGARRRTPYR